MFYRFRTFFYCLAVVLNSAMHPLVALGFNHHPEENPFPDRTGDQTIQPDATGDQTTPPDATGNETRTSGGDGTLDNPLGGIDTLQEFLAEILHIVALVALPFIVLAIIYTGFLFVSAQGNDTKLQKAKSAFTWTVVGALAILGAEVLSQAIAGTVNQLQGAASSPAIVEIMPPKNV